jgi:outer membrane protein assembly factor BamB
LWSHDTPPVTHQSLAAQGDRVCFHDYKELVALDKTTGKVAWTAESKTPIKWEEGIRAFNGNLIMHDGKVLYASSNWGGGNLYDAKDGKRLWTNARMGTTGGFCFPTALRIVKGLIVYDSLSGVEFATGKDARNWVDIGDMLKRGHHVRCFAGKATERFLILPHRGAEFVELRGQDHMANDWLRGACSYGLMPANGFVYGTPDPCSCYAGVKMNGLLALSAREPDLTTALPPGAPERLERGPAPTPTTSNAMAVWNAEDWPTYRADGGRSGFAAGAMWATLRPAWTESCKTALTPVVAAGGRVFVSLKDRNELACLDQASGRTLWRKPFGGALDGPPTIHAHQELIGAS